MVFVAIALLCGGCGGASSRGGASNAGVSKSGVSNTGGSNVGGSGDGGSTGSSSATAAHASPGSAPADSPFIAHADTLCKRIDAELTASTPANASKQAVIGVVLRHQALERKGLNELSGLHPPSALTRDWAVILADRRQLAAELLVLIRAVNKGDQAAIKAASASKARVHQALLASAKQAGFQHCGELG